MNVMLHKIKDYLIRDVNGETFQEAWSHVSLLEHVSIIVAVIWVIVLIAT